MRTLTLTLTRPPRYLDLPPQHLDTCTRRVQFWLFENFLSPNFKESARAMAAEYGFEVAYVTYKWPDWLHAQTEKQRIIWGYKILFLDVLFPLNLKKVIYVDADQVVRSDLAELWDIDMEGKPYGYVPFCDSREETLGFQFWRQGYWKEHLQGKPYHISALYVVDLQVFRYHFCYFYCYLSSALSPPPSCVRMCVWTRAKPVT